MSWSPLGSSSGFGSKVAISGDIIVVGGAFLWDSRYWVSQAFVFVKPPSGWSGFVTPSATLTPSDYRRGNHGGNAIPPVVGIVGDTIVLADGSAGKIYVFKKPAAGWVGSLREKARLSYAGIDPAHQFFPRNIAFDGHTVVALGFNPTFLYVYERPKSGWRGDVQPTARLVNSNPDGAFELAFKGDTIVAQTVVDSGAEVFVRPPGGWVDAGPVAVARLAQGALQVRSKETFLGVSFEATPTGGVPFILAFHRPAAGWSGPTLPARRLNATGASDLQALAANKDLVVAGDPSARVGNNAGQGEVFVFER